MPLNNEEQAKFIAKQNGNAIQRVPNYSSSKQVLIMTAIATVHFSSAICVSLQAPFYPKEAEQRNITSTYYGLVFGIFEAVSFVASPVFGNYVDILGAKNQLIAGMLIQGVCSVLFGLLDMVKGRDLFLAASFVIRIIEAVGSSAAITSAFGITASAFPDRVATVFSRLEVAYGLGYIFGPSIGGVLYDLGGYKLPFMVMGAILTLSGLSICYILPKMESQQPKTKMLLIFKIPEVIIDSLSIVAIAICMGFYSASLEPHVRQFGLSTIFVSLIFVIHGATYTITAPIVGYLCDRFGLNMKKVTILGCFLSIASALMAGPLPDPSLEPKVYLVIIGLITLGLSMSCIQMCAFVDAIRSAVAAGFPDDITTYSLVAGLWAASLSLGAFIGPSAAGWLCDNYGFRKATLFLVAVNVFTCCLWFGYFINVRRHRPKRAVGKQKLYIEEKMYTMVDKASKNETVNATHAEIM